MTRPPATEAPKTLIHPELLLKVAAMPAKDIQGFGEKVEDFYRLIGTI